MAATIKEGSKIPALELPDRNDIPTPLFEARHKFTVLYFYPKDDTPGCTLEAQGFSRMKGSFTKMKTRIVGISGGDARTKSKFCDKYDLGITLLSDTDFEVARRFGSYGPKVFMGRKYQGISRNTFVLDSRGIVIKVFESVKPEEHPAEVLEFVQSYSSTKSAPSGRKAAHKKSGGKKAVARTASKRSVPAGKAGKRGVKGGPKGATGRRRRA